MDNDAFFLELLEDFKLEAAEHLENIETGLLELEKPPASADDQSVVEMVFREMHSLKGAARAVDLHDIEQLCMNLESVFGEVKAGRLKLSPTMFDELHKASDMLRLLLTQVGNQSFSKPSQFAFLLKTIETIRLNPQFFADYVNAEPALAQKPTEQAVLPVQAETIILPEPVVENPEGPLFNKPEPVTEKGSVRISTEKLYGILQQAEELIGIKLSQEFISESVNGISERLKRYKKAEYSNGVSATASGSFMSTHYEDVVRLEKNIDDLLNNTTRVIDELLFNLKSLLLIPISHVMQIVPKMVRDLSRELGKEIRVEIAGGETELDRRIVEELKDPIIHLIRNCVDHGIESMADRAANGKNVSGLLQIHVIQDVSRRITVTVSDDGAGLSHEKLLAKALEKGIINASRIKEMAISEVHQLIFASGISTRENVTDLSGRGLGMSIVAEKVMKLGGTVFVESEPGKGTKFIITVPQSLSTFKGVVVSVAGSNYVVPVNEVALSQHITPEDIVMIESQETIRFNHEYISVLRLSNLLKVPHHATVEKRPRLMPVLIADTGSARYAILVDDIFEVQEGIIKDLGRQLQSVIGIAGVTYLKNGALVPVLNIGELVTKQAGHLVKLFNASDEPSAEHKSEKRLLVVDDSLTIRSMLRKLLESEGFTVDIAINGRNAFDMLSEKTYDLIVSDVEMPLMNGFELTAMVRKTASMAHLPLILVTALETEADKRRGLDAGADAYLVKSSFEKGNLIETINRLI